MTKQKIEIEVDIPEGYEFIQYSEARRGDIYLMGSTPFTWDWNYVSSGKYVIIRPIPEPLPLFQFPDWVKPGTWYCEDANGQYLCATEPSTPGRLGDDGYGFWSTGVAVSIGYLRNFIVIPEYRLHDDWRKSNKVKE